MSRQPISVPTVRRGNLYARAPDNLGMRSHAEHGHETMPRQSGEIPPRHDRQQGFSLVEIAIVMVIIGLLLGGVMQGQSLIRAAKVRDVISTAADITAATAAFKERYHVLPGDNPTATADIPGVTANGDGNGLISAAESAIAPSHLIGAGFIKGSSAGPIKTSYGFVWIVQRTVAMAGASPCGTAVNSTAPVPSDSNMMVFSNLTGDAAEEIDIKLDDGSFNTGSIRGSVAYTNATVQCLALPL